MIKRSAAITISQEHVVRAARLASSRKLGFPIWPLLILGVAVSIFSMWWDRMDDNWMVSILAPILLVLVMIVALLLYVVTPWQARSQYRQSASVKDEIAAEWDDARIWLSGEHGSLNYAWSDYHRWSEDSAILLLYHSDATFNVIPKSALTDAQCADIVRLLHTAGVRKR